MAKTAPLDQALGRTSSLETGDSPLGGEAFQKDLHSTPVVLWVAVALMSVGFTVIGVGAIILDHVVATGWVSIASGAVLGAVGAVLGLINGIMNNVE